MIDDCCEDWVGFAEVTGAPEVSESCLIFTEVCETKPESKPTSIFSSYDFGGTGEDEREEMSEQRQHRDFIDKLKHHINYIDVITYAP